MDETIESLLWMAAGLTKLLRRDIASEDINIAAARDVAAMIEHLTTAARTLTDMATRVDVVEDAADAT